MPKALITGVAGQTGSYLAESLEARGWEVHGIARTGDRADGPDVLQRIRLYDVDVTAEQPLRALIGDVAPDALFNLAAVSSVARSWTQPVMTADVNGTAVATMLSALSDSAASTGHSPVFVQASSAEIFGHPDVTPQDERTPIRPTNPYGAAKAFAHQLVGVYRATGVRASNCVLYNHESPRRPETFVTRKITMGVALIALGLRDELVLGNLDARRDWGWAPDYADAMMRVALSGTASDYVVASGVGHSVREFVDAAFAAAGVRDGRVRTDDEFVRPTDAPALVGDATRIRAELGWRPTVAFEEMVRLMVENDLALLTAAR